MKRQTVYHVLIICCFGFIAYGNTFLNGFVFDDKVLIVNNENIKHFQYIPKFFTGEFFDIDMRFHQGGYYRPLILFSFLIDFMVWKLNPLGYHVTNLALHLFNAGLLYMLLLQIISSPMVSLISVLLFVIHPVQTAAVSYISGRTDVMALSFMLVFLWFGIKLIKDDKSPFSSPFLYLCLLAYLGGLFSKEIAIISPVLLVCYAFLLVDKDLLRKKFLNLGYLFSFCVGIAFIYLLIRAIVLNSFSGGSGKLFFNHLLLRLLLIPKVIASYCAILFYPFNLHFERFVVFPVSVVSYFCSLLTWVYIFCFLLLVYSVFLSYRRDKAICFGLMFFLIALSPGMQIIPILVNGKLFTPDHFLYIPSIGFFLAIVLLIKRIWKPAYLKIGIIFFSVISVLLVGFTIKQNLLFENNLSFYQSTLENSPDSARVHNNLGNAYSNKRDFEKALKEYEHALAIDPAYVKTYVNMGDLYTKQGLYDKAQEYYFKAMEKIPYDHVLLSNIGVNFDRQKKYKEAIRFLEKSIKVKPNYKEAYDNLGTVYAHQGRFAEAIRFYHKALSIDKAYAKTYYHIGNLLLNQKKYKEAIDNFKIAISYEPKLIGAYNNLGIAYQQVKDFDASIAIYQKALRLHPNDFSLHNNLGATYLYNNNDDLALTEFLWVARHYPNDAMAHYNVGSLFIKKKVFLKAKDAFLKARNLDEKDLDTSLSLSFACYQLGEKKAAMDELLRILKFYPGNREVKHYLQKMKNNQPIS